MHPRSSSENELWPHNKEELATIIQQAYVDMSLEKIEVFIVSMPFQMTCRTSAIVESSGW